VSPLPQDRGGQRSQRQRRSTSWPTFLSFPKPGNMSLVDAGRWFGDFQDRSGSFSFSVFHAYQHAPVITSLALTQNILSIFSHSCNILQQFATYTDYDPWFPTISHVARLLVPEPPELERGGKRPRPGRGPDIGTVGLDAISGSIRYAMLCRCAAWSHGCSLLYGTVWMSWWTG
jgi:hypothetical protein